MQDKRYVPKPRTLCWDCAKAMGGCSWSNHWDHEPVPGWKAEKVELKVERGVFIESYVVIDCPEFDRDACMGGAYKFRKNVKNEDEI